jgi:hypothetical protein
LQIIDHLPSGTRASNRYENTLDGERKARTCYETEKNLQHSILLTEYAELGHFLECLTSDGGIARVRTGIFLFNLGQIELFQAHIFVDVSPAIRDVLLCRPTRRNIENSLIRQELNCRIECLPY